MTGLFAEKSSSLHKRSRELLTRYSRNSEPREQSSSSTQSGRERNSPSTLNRSESRDSSASKRLSGAGLSDGKIGRRKRRRARVDRETLARKIPRIGPLGEQSRATIIADKRDPLWRTAPLGDGVEGLYLLLDGNRATHVLLQRMPATALFPRGTRRGAMLSRVKSRRARQTVAEAARR